MQKALAAGVAVSLVCSFMGVFLVLRRYSLFGDGIAHVAFGGVSAGLFLGVFPLWTAFAAAALGALGLQRLRDNTRMSGDSAVAVVLVSGLGIGVILVSASGGFSIDLFGFLFGSILLIGDGDTAMILGISAGILAALTLLHRRFLHIAFNEEQARISGMRVTLLNYAFVVLASVTVVVSMRLVGILLISALIVIPNIAAIMLGRGFRQTVAVSMSIAASSVAGGILLSYHYDIAPSGTIVVVAVGALLAVLAARSAGLVRGPEKARPGITHNA